MTNEEYLETQNQVLLLAGLCQRMPLKEFLGRINTAETIGPIVDPTLWMKESHKMDEIKNLAVKLLALQDEVNKSHFLV